MSFEVGDTVRFREDWIQKYRNRHAPDQRIIKASQQPYMTVVSARSYPVISVELDIDGFRGTWDGYAIELYKPPLTLDERLFEL